MSYPHETLVVQKYGGMLLRDLHGLRQAAEDVRTSLESGRRVVVVVSAMGRSGDPYATDTLESLARSITAQPDPQSLDLLLSAGELISTALMTLQLRQLGRPAAPFSGFAAGIVTTREFGRARIERLDAEPLLKACRSGVTPVVAGFQGVTEELEMTTLGRGGSDLTAVAIGADLVEIVKEVDGVMTADPAVVPEVRRLPAMSHEDLLLLTTMGSKVVQAQAVELAARCGVRLVVRKLGHKEGTHVDAADGVLGRGTRPRLPALTHRKDLALISLRPRSHKAGWSRLADLLTAGDRSRCLYVSAGDDSLTACADRQTVHAAGAALAGNTDVNVELAEPCGVITLVGLEARNAGAVVAAAVRHLAGIGVRVLHAHRWDPGASLVMASADVDLALPHVRELLGEGPAEVEGHRRARYRP